MDKAIAEWNGRVVHYLVFALIALAVIYLWVRFFRKRTKVECDYCGRRLYKRPKFREVVEGMMHTFCNRTCYNDFRADGPLPANERQVRRANEVIEETVN